jgi:hypothetical protein
LSTRETNGDALANNGALNTAPEEAHPCEQAARPMMVLNLFAPEKPLPAVMECHIGLP